MAGEVVSMNRIDEHIRCLELTIKGLLDDERIMRKDLQQIRDRRKQAEKELLKKLKAKKDGEDGKTHRSALQCESDL